MNNILVEPLGKLCESIDYGVTASANFETTSGPKLLRITDITDTGVNWEKVPSCKISNKEERGSLLCHGDIVIARTGGTVGKSYLIEAPPRAVNASYLLRVRAKSDIIIPEYLALFLCSDSYWAQLLDAAQGAAQPNVNATKLATILVPFPSIFAQRCIAAQLKAQLTAVEEARNAALAQFSDATLLSTRIREQALTKLDHINRVPLGNLLTGIEAGKSFQTTDRLAQDSELGVLKVSAVSWSAFQPQEAKAIEGNYVPQDHHRVYKGDMLISRANTVDLVGAVVRVDQDYPNRLLSDKTLRLLVDATQVLPEFLLHVLRMPEARKHIEDNATGTSDSMRNISQETIRSIPVVLPGIETQRKIAAHLEQVDTALNELTLAVKTQLKEINLLPSKILAKAFDFNN